MSIIKDTGLNRIHNLVRQENPWLPHGIGPNSVRISDVRELEPGLVEAVFSGRHNFGYVGRTRVKYRNNHLATLFGGKALVIGVTEARPLHEQLPDIQYTTGVLLGKDDVENIVPESVELPYVTTIQAKATSAAYVGSVEVTFEKRKPRLDEAVPWSDYDLHFAAYDPSTTDRARGEFLTYGNDYTLSASELSTMDLGVLIDTRAERLANAIKLVDLQPWTFTDTRGFWSLLGAKVVYNGRTVEYSSVDGIRLPNTRYTHVAIIDMLVDRAPGDLFGSSLFIHYNVME